MFVWGDIVGSGKPKFQRYPLRSGTKLKEEKPPAHELSNPSSTSVSKPLYNLLTVTTLFLHFLMLFGIRFFFFIWLENIYIYIYIYSIHFLYFTEEKKEKGKKDGLDMPTNIGVNSVLIIKMNRYGPIIILME